MSELDNVGPRCLGCRTPLPSGERSRFCSSECSTRWSAQGVKLGRWAALDSEEDDDEFAIFGLDLEDELEEAEEEAGLEELYA